MDRVIAEYVLETPMPVQDVAAMMAGEQSSGTFVRVEGETDEVRARSAAEVLSIEEIGQRDEPSMASAFLDRKNISGPCTIARVRIAYPVGNVGRNLPTLAATVTGNLYDVGEVTGLKLVSLDIPAAYRARYALPTNGIIGTRNVLNVQDRPIFGTIIKPNVGMATEDIAALVDRLCAAGVDFIKDDELCANPDMAPFAERVPAVMNVIRKWQDTTGRRIMMAFNVTDEADQMRRNVDLVEAEEGSCVMASINWCGLSGIETLRNHTDLILHAHRNGYSAMSRHPQLGIGFQAYHALYRLAGIDHMHVHGLDGKFVNSNAEVIEAARNCLSPLSAHGPDDRVMPVFSSGQWAGTLPQTHKAAKGSDFMFICGGGVLAHPMGAEAGIASLHEAYEAAKSGVPLEAAAGSHPALSDALDFFGSK